MASKADFTSKHQEALTFLETTPQRAFEEFRRLSNEGYAPSMLQLAWCYHKGIGAAQELSLAEVWYRRASEAGEDHEKGEAEKSLIQLRIEQIDKIRKEEPKRAFEEFRKLSEDGCLDATVELAWCYYNGIGTLRDLSLAERLSTRVFEEGDDCQKIKAESVLHWMRFDHACEIRKEAPESAFEVFRQLSEEGFPPAMPQLAWCYNKGIGATRDLLQAETWYQCAIEKGSEQVKHEAEKYLNYLRRDRVLSESKIRSALARIYSSSLTYWVLRFLGGVLLIIYYTKPRELDFSLIWFFVFIVILVSVGSLGGLIEGLNLWPALNSTIIPSSPYANNEENEDEGIHIASRNFLRSAPQLIFVPLEDALFCIPILIYGVNPWLVILSGVFFGLAHLGSYTYGQCITKSVSYTLAMFIVLPHGLLTMMAGHLLVDLLTVLGMTVLFILTRDTKQNNDTQLER